MSGTPYLNIKDLTVAYRDGDVWLEAVRDFSMQIVEGQTYGLVGESGSGKTTVALSVMRYLGQNGRVLSGAINFRDFDMLAMSSDQLRDIWGKDIALVPQDPQSSLNPSMRISDQIGEVLRRHLGLNRSEAAQRTLELLAMVQVPDPERVARSCPHQISGGMQQRVLIAMAISTEPELLILDEPTTGLDVTTQAAVLDLIRALTAERQTAALYVTHNLGVVANLCDRVAVVYAGELVEDATVGALFTRPLHPYTEGLIESIPRVGQTKSEVTLRAIPGHIPPLGERPGGCLFAPRCSLAVEKCFSERPDLEISESGRLVRCHRWREIAAGEISTRIEPNQAAPAAARESPASVLQLDGVEVYFTSDRTLADSLRRRPGQVVKAVDGVDLTLNQSQTLGIVGESGSGKTTLARAIVGLAERTAGEMALLQFPLPVDLSSRSLETLRHLQYVFQNPDEALNPNMTVGQTLSRPFVTLQGMSRQEAGAQVIGLLAAVQLPASFADRYPNQLSGGEKQRVAIARAFATTPDLLIADEPVSSLDVSVQASILNLLHDLQQESGNSLILISHDLAVVGYLADRIAVMYLGRILEFAVAENLFVAPMHPYTEALVAAIPTLDPHALQDYVPLEGDIPSQIDVPGGCPFHPRCPRIVGDICRADMPTWQENEAGDRILCHIPLVELRALQSPAGQKQSMPEPIPVEKGKGQDG